MMSLVMTIFMLFFPLIVSRAGSEIELCQVLRIAWPFNVGRWVNFGQCSKIIPTYIGFEEPSSYWSVQFFSVFHWTLYESYIYLNGPKWAYYRIGPDGRPCIAAVAGHSLM